MTAALEGGEWSSAHPGRTLPLGKTRYPFYRRLGGPEGRSGRVENFIPTGIRSRTVQPVAQSLCRLSYRAYILFNNSRIHIKTLKTLVHVSITRSSSGSILCSLLKLQFKTLGDLLRYINLVLWQHVVCCV